MALQASIWTRDDSVAARDERRRPVLAMALGMAALVALGETGPSLACRIMSAAAPMLTMSQPLRDVRSYLDGRAAVESGPLNSDEYVPQVTRIIRFPADEL